MDKINKIIRRHIFGFFIISLSTIQFLSIANAETIPEIPDNRKPALHLISDSVKAKKAPIFQRPVKGYLSQGFWYAHPAIDIPKPVGTKVKPIEAGKVTYTGWDGGYGYTVVIKHNAGFSSRYAHLSGINTKDGAKVTKKTVIGGVGATGYATGSHLHLEIYDEGKVVNPQKYLPKN